MKKNLIIVLSVIILLILIIGGGAGYYIVRGNTASEENNEYVDKAIVIQNSLRSINDQYESKFDEISNVNEESATAEDFTNFQKSLSDYSLALAQELPKISNLRNSINTSENSEAYQANQSLKKYLEIQEKQILDLSYFFNGFGCFFNILGQNNETLKNKQIEIERGLETETQTFEELAAQFRVQAEFFTLAENYFLASAQCNQPSEGQILPQDIVENLTSLSGQVSEAKTITQEGVAAAEQENESNLIAVSQKITELTKGLELDTSLDSFNQDDFNLQTEESSQALKELNSEVQKLSDRYIFASFSTIVEES
jgi:hypothetical protein